MKKRKAIGLLEVNILYFLTAILLLTAGSYVQYKNIKIGLIITEYLFVLLPPLIYLKLRGVCIKDFLRLNKLPLKQVSLIVGITILGYPIALFFNLVVMIFLSLLGNPEQMPIPVAKNIGEYIILMMIIAVSAGICEEVFFRGLVMHTYEKMGKRQAIVLSAFLFGLFHFNIQNFAGPVILGLVFGYLVYITNSLFAGIIGHITNNGLAVTMSFVINWINEKILGTDSLQTYQRPSTFEMVLSAFSMGVIAIITGFGAYLLLKSLMKEVSMNRTRENIEKIGEKDIEKGEYGQKPSILVFIPVGMSILVFIYFGYLQLMDIINEVRF